MITASKYKARATGKAVLGKSQNKGTPFFEVYFEITEGENKGGQVRWTSYFHDTKDANGKTGSEKLFETIFMMGWETEDGDVGVFADGELHGIDKNEVQIDVELESYEKDGQQLSSPRVKWVNKLGGFLNVANAMNTNDARSFGEKFRGLALKAKSRQVQVEPQGDPTDFAFGANAPAEQKKAAGTRKGW